MGVLGHYLERRVADEVADRGVLVWYDPDRRWVQWVTRLLNSSRLPSRAEVRQVQLGGRRVQLVPFAGSYYETLWACEQLAGGESPTELLVYVAGELPPERLSPLRELECLGGIGEHFLLGLTDVARAAFRHAGLAEVKVDELVNRPGITFELLDKIALGEEGSASPLQPIFGSSREVDVLPAFLADATQRREAARTGLADEVCNLFERGFGMGLKERKVADETPEQHADRLANQLVRILLVAEMRSDLTGAEPKAISQLPRPKSEVEVGRVREVCRRLRMLYPEAYENLANEVESEFGLASVDIDALTLGEIDTFAFEEKRLLAACNRLIADGMAESALEIVRQRAGSYWVSVSRFPERHAAWEACGELAQLMLTAAGVEHAIKQVPRKAKAWVDAYTSPDGWHRLDRSFRTARHRLSRLSDDYELEEAASATFVRYDALAERMAEGFADALRATGWHVENIISQTEIYDRYVAGKGGPTAYLLVDAMRFEMGAALAELIEAAGAERTTLEPAIAAAPTVTEIGMAALLPGAQRSFSIAEGSKGVAGVVDGSPLEGSAARMDHAKAAVPGLVEMTLDRLLNDVSAKKLRETVNKAPVIIIRSQEIDGAGESLPDSLARVVMDTALESIRKGVLRLVDAGVNRFVVVADHGHLFGTRRGDEMKIDPPTGGQTVDLHRRCWVGRGGNTPSSCVRIPANHLGYGGTDLDIVVPRGLGVFKAGGSLVYHHGGLSLQEQVVPVLSFELTTKTAKGATAAEDLLGLDGVPEQITNMIFSLTLRRIDLPIEPLRVRIIAEAQSERGAQLVGQVIFATQGWDASAKTLSLAGTEAVSVGIQIENEDIEELRVLVVEAETERTLKDTPPIPVRITK